MPNNELKFKCKCGGESQHPCNNLRHITKVRRVQGGGPMFNEIEQEDKE
jgi:hypothetical protein